MPLMRAVCHIRTVVSNANRDQSLCFCAANHLIYRGVRVCAGNRVGMQVCYDVHRKQLLLFVVKSISRKVSIQTENRRLTPVFKNVRRAGKS